MIFGDFEMNIQSKQDSTLLKWINFTNVTFNNMICSRTSSVVPTKKKQINPQNSFHASSTQVIVQVQLFFIVKLTCRLLS